MITLDSLLQYDDPRHYVSLESGERALAEIDASLGAGRSPVLISGPVGVGKTKLLHVLADRERASRVSVRFARSIAHPPDAVGSWLLRLLFGKTASSPGEAELVLLERLREIADTPILLLVDEIHLAPIGSVRKLAALARGGAPALHLVVCGTEGPDLNAVTTTLVPEATVLLPDSLPEGEIEALYDAILAHPGLSPRVLRRLEWVARAEIVRAASGRPGRLRAELARHMPRGPARPPPRPASVTPAAEPARAFVPVFPAPVADEIPGRPARQRIRAATAKLVSLLRAAVSAGVRSTTGSVTHCARSLSSSALAAWSATRRLAASAHARLTRVRERIAVAVLAQMASLSRKIDSLDRARHTGAAWLARAWVRARAPRALPAAALPATALLAVAVFLLSDYEPGSEARLRGPSAVSDVTAESHVSVQVNARPWATVRIDGVDLGATPLSHRLAPGVYQLEAEFPDGKRIERKIDVRAESRFVSLP